MEKKLIWWYILVALVIGFLIGMYFNKQKVTEYIDNTIYKTNTVEKIVNRDVIKFKGNGKIKYIDRIDSVYIHDTLYKIKPFVASLDTIVNDTINIDYAYPDNKFYVYVAPKVDTVKVELPIKVVKEKEIDWYYTLGGSISGFLIGILSR